MSWEKGDAQLSTDQLEVYLKGVLKSKKLPTKDEWKLKARQDLRYDTAKAVCKFALFVAAHDTEPDDSSAGLMKIAIKGTDPHLTPLHWRDPDFSSIEHVAPQTRDSGGTWSKEIYVSTDQQRIGNLILLPVSINSVAGNKRWLEKWLYYEHLAQTDPIKRQELTILAGRHGVNLATKTIKKLYEAEHQRHIRSIVNLGIGGNWDKQLIERRTDRICDILWARISPWLKPETTDAL